MKSRIPWKKKLCKKVVLTSYYFLLLLYFVIIIVSAIRTKPFISSSPIIQSSFGETILNSIPNGITLAGGIVGIVVIALSDYKKGKKATKRIVVYSVLFFLSWIVYSVAQAYNINSSWFTLYGLVLFSIYAFWAIYPRKDFADGTTNRLESSFKYYLNPLFSSIQLYDVFQTTNKDNIFSIKFRDSYTKDYFDINAVLSQTFVLDTVDKANIDALASAYLDFLTKDGSHSKKAKTQANAIIELIDNHTEVLQKTLSMITDADSIEKEACVKASLFFLECTLKAMLGGDVAQLPKEKMLSNRDVFCGLDFYNIELATTNDTINNRLRSTVRTGFLLPLLFNNSYSFCFQYEGTGYKKDRFYWIFRIEDLPPHYEDEKYLTSLCIVTFDSITDPKNELVNNSELFRQIGTIEQIIRSTYGGVE